MEATNTRPLMQKVYHENCPGCKQEQRSDGHVGIPYREFFCIFVLTLCYVIPALSIYPYLYFLIRDLHIARREEDIGFYAGFVGSSFMFGRLFTSVFWGIVADQYGRKPVAIINIISVIVFNTLFGLGTNYWMAITSRTLLGLFSGLLGLLKAYASEVCRKEHQALGLSLVVTSLSIGSVVSPAIGGFLAQPAEKFPNINSWTVNYLAINYTCYFVPLMPNERVCNQFQETLHMHNEVKMRGDNIKDLEGLSIVCDGKENGENEGRMLASERSLIQNWPLMSSIIVYCVFLLQEMANTEHMQYFRYSPYGLSDKKYGGLSFSSQDVGEILAISGFALVAYQPIFYPFFTKYLGPIISAHVAVILSIPLLSSYPFMSKLSGFKLSLIVTCASFSNNVLTTTIMTGIDILQNNAVPQHQRGAANGISVAISSLFRAVGPAGAGALYSAE